jgi:AraC-like DNA-binding protein
MVPAAPAPALSHGFSKKLSFSFAGAPRGPAYEAWREDLCRGFCQLDVASSSKEWIQSTVEFTRMGDLSFAVARHPDASFMRTLPLLADGCDDLALITAVSGVTLNVQRGRAVELRPSQMSLISMDELVESRLSENGVLTALRIPRRLVAAFCPDVDEQVSKPLLSAPTLSKVVSDYSALCLKAAPTLEPVGQQVMARQMTELIGLLLRAERDEALPPLRQGYGEARLQLIKAYVIEHLDKRGLSIASAARRAGLTPKTVQRLFKATGMTFAEFVLEQRLLLAHRLISSPTAPREKIGSIALDAGFGDPSYFNRTFRQRFGMTPSEWRDAQPDWA